VTDSSVPGLLQELTSRDRHDPHDGLVRLIVRSRARESCEYCLAPALGQFHLDHIIPGKCWKQYTEGKLVPLLPSLGRRGPDHLDNYALSCAFCNSRKQDRVSLRLWGRRIRLFDPRLDSWSEHFMFANRYLHLVGKTPVGQATEQALGFNHAELDGPLGVRHQLIVTGHYPPPWAVREM